MLPRKTLFSLILVTTGAGAGPAIADPKISADRFDRLHRLIKPQAGESKWARIPWLTNLQEARKRAAAEDKPLLLWRAGGGDVLGRA
jgi:hypothetical protein